MIDSTGTDNVVSVEFVNFTNDNDTLTLLGDLSLLAPVNLRIDMRGADSGTYDKVDAAAATTGVYVNLGTGRILGLDQDTDVDGEGWQAESAAIDFRASALTVVNGNEVIGTQYSDYLVGGNGGPGETRSILRGGAGNDLIVAGGAQTLMYGGNGNDQFAVGANSWILDASKSDVVTYHGYNIYGGIKQFWMSGNSAYYTPISGIMNAYVTIGSLFIGAVAVLFEVSRMSFVSFQRSQDGYLVMDLLWGFGGKAYIKDYDLDFGTGRGSAGVTVFEVDYSFVPFHGFSFQKFEQYVNLALKAGFGRGIRSDDPLVLDLDGDGTVGSSAAPLPRSSNDNEGDVARAA